MKKVSNSIGRMFDNEMLSTIMYEDSVLDQRAKDSVTMLTALHLLKSEDIKFTNVIEFTFATQYYSNKLYDMLLLGNVSSIVKRVDIVFARDYTTYRIYSKDEVPQLELIQFNRYYISD